MKVIKIIPVLFLFFFCENLAWAQNINLDEYELDTIIKPSEVDPLVMDTVITARKKVVVKKEVIVENEIFVPAILADKTVHMIFSPEWFRSHDLYESAHTEVAELSQPEGYLLGLEFQSNVYEAVRLGATVTYSWFKQDAWFEKYNETVLQTQYEQIDTLETYYIGQTPYYITDSKTITETDTLRDTSFQSNSNKFKAINFDIAIGKLFQTKYFELYPRVTVGYHKAISISGYDYNNQTKEIYTAPFSKQKSFRMGASVMVLVPVLNNFGVNIIPNITFYNNFYPSVNYSKTVSYAVFFGAYYKFSH